MVTETVYPPGQVIRFWENPMARAKGNIAETAYVRPFHTCRLAKVEKAQHGIFKF